jgi:O-antigen/teichoic acid export membrane protein
MGNKSLTGAHRACWAPSNPTERRVLAELTLKHGAMLRSYASTLAGSAGRLVISLLYFVSLANSLSISDFGLFASASAAGIVLSRIISFGFVSPLYRTATVKPQLLGTYYAGFLAAALLSLPVAALAGWAIYRSFFAGLVSASVFFVIVTAEMLLWRSLETIVIVNNGLNRFGRAAMMVVIGTALRAASAFGFALLADHSLGIWAACYFIANAVSLAVALLFYLPRRRLRLRPRLYLSRSLDALWTSGAEILFYIQMELDKLAVLAIGGAELAGIYAIVMRLADLTALPVRAFNMLLVQKMMRTAQTLRSLKTRMGIELLVFGVSAAGFAALAALLWLYPNALGRNVSLVAGFLGLALCVPGFRNLVEYHAELLYARRQTGLRMLNLGLLAAAKMVMLAFVLAHAPLTRVWLAQLNAVFALLWACSALLTYSAMRTAPRGA